MTNYGHVWEVDNRLVCALCQVERTPDPEFEGPCPERIVQEVVLRVAAELQKVGVVPAKRRDRPR